MSLEFKNLAFSPQKNKQNTFFNILEVTIVILNNLIVIFVLLSYNNEITEFWADFLKGYIMKSK